MQLTEGVDRDIQDIPSMGGREIGLLLRKLAAEVPSGGRIVEVGSWLGAGTAQLALGARRMDNPPTIHCYDYWTASEQEVQKAGNLGVTLAIGQDTLPLVRARIEALADNVVFHKGSISGITWNAGEIALYVDDAAKQPRDFHHVLTTFGPSWVPGVTVLVLMDYYFWKKKHGHAAAVYKCQQKFIEAHPAHFRTLPDIGQRIPGFREVKGWQSGTEAFLYTRAFDFAGLEPFKIPVNYRALLPPVIRKPLGRISRLLGV